MPKKTADDQKVDTSLDLSKVQPKKDAGPDNFKQQLISKASTKPNIIVEDIQDKVDELKIGAMTQRPPEPQPENEE